MTHLFSALLEQSLTACWVIPAVLLLRFCLKKAPKRVTNLLWLVVAFRLICPVSFESNLSLVTQAQNLSHAAAELRDEIEAYRPVDTQPTVTLPEDIVFDNPVTPTEPVWPENPALPIIPESPEAPEIVIPPVETPREQPFISRQLVLRAGCGIWLAGVAAMALFGLISTRQWRKRVQTAVRCEDGLWRSESVESPFILGVLRPKIYLPFVLPFGAESHVIAHEQAHLKRRDPLWKCFAFALLAVYWFHPLVWVSYFLFCRDIELACDQQVTRYLDAEGKKAYSRALLACTVSRDPLLCPLSFGEVGVKARVKAVLRKNPSKVFVFTALVLCTILIICCAANPKEEHPWDEAYRQTLEDLLKQYGANEDYGLQSVTTLDLWEDGVPELLVVRKVDETVHSEAVTTLMIYEYTGGEAVLRYDASFSKTSGNTEILWNRAEVGVRFMVFTELTDKADYPNVQKAQVITVSNPIPDDWSVSSRLYNQMEDGRWIDHGHSSGYEARILDEAEVTALFSDIESLMGLDWQKFLKENWGAVSYQYIFAEALTQLNKDRRYEPRYTELVDFDLDGIPEMITTMGDRIYVYFCDLENGTYDLTRTIDVGGPYGQPDNHIYALNIVQGKPTLIVHGTLTSMEFIQAFTWGDGNMAHGGNVRLFTAKGDGTGLRSNLTDHETWHEKDGNRITDPEEYERLRAELLQDAVEYDLDYLSPSLSNSGYTNIEQLYACDYPLFQFPTEPDMSKVYAPVLRALIGQYDFFDAGDGTLPVLGLKYAGLYDLGGDETPELVTLVNTKDEDNVLHMTLRVHNTYSGNAQIVYQTELGSRHMQTDVSYSFAVKDGLLVTYHSPSEWYEEEIHVVTRLGGTMYEPELTVYHAVATGEDGKLEQYFIDNEPVSAGHYGHTLYNVMNGTMEIDACWDVAPASKADLEAFLAKMKVVLHEDPPVGYGETAAEAHHSMLSGLMTVHGTTPDGIVGATIVDLEQDGVPELLVQHGMALELYRYEKNHSRLIWNGNIGVRFGQTDASYEYIITTHIDTFCIIIHDSKDAWMEEVWRVITLENGVIHEKELRAWAEADTSFLPERDNLIHFSIDGVEVPEKRYYYQLIDYIDGGMAVSAVHPYARPNSGEYMADLLNQLAAGNLPEIGDSEHRAIAWWLMANNDGEPLDEQTALKFGAAKREFPAEPPIRCEEGSVFMWNEPYDFCRYVQNGGEEWLILAYREERTEIARGTAYHVNKNGYLTAVEKDLVLDTFRATLVGDFDGQTLVHRRYHTDCYSGMDGCQDCFRSDLILWNAERTEYVKLMENEPLAELFTVISRDERWVYVTYQTGPAHSEYNQQTTLRINLEEKTCVQVGREGLTDSPNVLMTNYPHVDDPYTAPLHAVMDNASTALLPQAWDERQLWLALEFPDREHWTLYRNGQTVYGVNRDGQTKRLDPVCIELIEAMGMEHVWGTMWDYARQLHRPTGFVLKIDGQPVAVDSDFAMLDWFGANHSPMLDVEQLGELLNVPVEAADDAIRTQPEGLRASLGFYDTWITVTDGKQSSEVQCFYNPATFEGRHYVPADALQGLFSVAMTWSEQNDVWTLELTTLPTLKAMAADAAAQLGAVYTPRGPMEDRLMVGYQTVVDYGGGQALMNFLPDLNRPIFALGPVLHKMTMLDRGYLRTYESNGKVTQSLYAQAISSETIPLEYDEITCIDQRVQLYSLKKNGKYGFAFIPWGNYTATVSPCRWEKPMSITEMCGALASYNATGEW